MPHRTLALLILALALLSLLACSGSQPEMQAFTWDSGSPAGAVSFEAPVGWDWDTEYIEYSESQDFAATGVHSPESAEGYAEAIIAPWEGPVDEWVDTLSETISEDEDVIAHKVWDGEVNDAPAIFLRTDTPVADKSLRGTRALEVYVMPEGNGWAWRVGCVAALIHEHHVKACEAIANSVKSG